MKFNKILTLILIIFLKTGNVLSEESIFNVNNIEINNRENISIENLTKKAIKKGFVLLQERILVPNDRVKLSNLEYKQVRDLVLYYQIKEKKIKERNEDTVIFNVFFDKKKLHNLFFIKDIYYAEIVEKEIYLLPIFKKNNRYLIYNKNYFYENWNKNPVNDLIEFILPLEKIEVIEKINLNENDLLSLDLSFLFQEYSNKNLALVLIEDNNSKVEKIFLKTNIQGKKINKTILVKKENLSEREFYEKIIFVVKEEITNLIKFQNLIDIKTPSFLNVNFVIEKKNNLAQFNERIKKIDLIENIYVQQLNKNNVKLRIKFLGKINKLIDQLKIQNIILQIKNEEWEIKIL